MVTYNPSSAQVNITVVEVAHDTFLTLTTTDYLGKPKTQFTPEEEVWVGAALKETAPPNIPLINFDVYTLLNGVQKGVDRTDAIGSISRNLGKLSVGTHVVKVEFRGATVAGVALRPSNGVVTIGVGVPVPWYTDARMVGSIGAGLALIAGVMYLK